MRVRLEPLGDKNMTGKKIKQIRRLKGLKQRNLVEMLSKYDVHMTVSVLSKVESQIRMVTDYELLAFSRALDVSLNELLGID